MTNMIPNSKIGRLGEDEAVKFLTAKGYKILHQNYDLPMGELDIVAIKDKRLSFIEVKTSLDTHSKWFSPEERVDKKKRQRLQNLCETYILREGYPPDTVWQVDVISVLLDNEGKNPQIEFIENAVWDYRGV